MLLSEPLASLITFFRTSLIKLYLNSQQISDSFYHILSYIILITIKLEINAPKHTHLTMKVSHVLQFLRRMTSRCKHKYMNTAST